jgi:uncharacterized protein DUF3352
MTAAIRIVLLVLALVILLGLGAWYFFFAPSKVAAAELVPADTVVFATIPNGAHIALDYETSHLKEIVDSPNAKPVLDGIRSLVGEKRIDLLLSLLPDLTGQSFYAAGPNGYMIVALHPKFGGDDIDGLLAKFKAAYPDALAQAQTTTAQIDGLDYRLIEGQDSHFKICVAQARGWVVFTTNETVLQDWWSRLKGNAPSPSLGSTAAYQTAVQRTGPDQEAFFYADTKTLARFSKNAPRIVDAASAYAASARFEGGDIVDRYSLALPRDAQNDLGLAPAPCPFETLKFTGPDTRFYWAASFNWSQVWENLQGQAADPAPSYPILASLATNLQSWAQAHNLDVQRNIIDPLGGEISVQSEWSDDSSYPDLGLFVKLDHPDDFKPVTAALVDWIRQGYENRAVVNELNSNGQNFATLKFLQPLPVSPTITEDGPYFGAFLTETHAVRSFQRDGSIGLLKNSDFVQKIGDRQAKASQIFYLDSPRLLNRAYTTALPYLSLAAMISPRIGAMAQGQNLPQDLQWLTPMGTWIAVVTSDDDGLTAYSSSGIGNQGLLWTGVFRQAWAFLPHSGAMGASFLPAPPPPPAAPAPVTPPVPAVPSPDTNAAPATPPVVPPTNAAATNTAPAPVPATNAPATNQ